MPHRRLFLGATLLLALGLSAGSLRAEPVTITILHTNDVYEIAPKRGRGGLAELMTLLERERSRSPHNLTTFGGDLISPSVLSGLTKGEQMIELYNALRTDVAVPGNHEFDFGPETAEARIRASNFPWLGTNLRDREGQPAVGTRDVHMVERGGFKIGLFGLVEPETAVLSSPGGAISFADPLATAEAAVKQLKDQGADLVIALTHLDIAEDRAIAAKVRGLDLLLGGHDHDPITFLENGKLIVKAGSDAHWLAVVDLAVDRIEQGGKPAIRWTPSWRYVANTNVPPHPQIKPIVDRWNERLDKELAVPIGEIAVPLDSRRDAVRTTETAIGNLIADAMRLAMNADVAITNGGGIRGDRTYPAGTVLTRKDILTELPFGNVTVLVELQGADLVSALENGVSQVEQKAGRFPQVSGLTFGYDPKRPAGQRVVEVRVGGAPIEPGRTYRVATNDYMLGGGDGYTALGRGKVLVDASGATLMASTVMNYVTALGGKAAPMVEGRIRRTE